MKKLLCLVTCFFMIASMTACSKDTSSKNDSNLVENDPNVTYTTEDFNGAYLDGCDELPLIQMLEYTMTCDTDSMTNFDTEWSEGWEHPDAQNLTKSTDGIPVTLTITWDVDEKLVIGGTGKGVWEIFMTYNKSENILYPEGSFIGDGVNAGTDSWDKHETKQGLLNFISGV